MKKLQELKDLVQEAIDSGATNIEEIHKSLASKPFEVLKKISLSGDAVERLEDFQDQTIGNVYEFIRTVNQKVGEIATELLKVIEKDERVKEQEDLTTKRCRATTKSGNQCKKNAIAGSKYCSVHQPK